MECRARNMYALLPVAALVALLLHGTGAGEVLEIRAECRGRFVGTIEVRIDAATDRVEAGFSPGELFETLAATALACDRQHLNWYQIVTWSNYSPLSDGGTRLAAPWTDPPLDGYADDPATAGANETHWADHRPWFWDEGADPPAGTPGWTDGSNLADNEVDGNRLLFTCVPIPAPGRVISYKTWLAALRTDGTLPIWLGGFGWEWIGADAANLKPLCDAPSEEEFDALVPR